MGRLRTVHAVEHDRVVVDAGATWREVLAATLPRGLAPPGLPDYLDLSVGGTLVVGGVGSAVSRSGVLSDHVLELQVVTGRGERRTCSPHSDPGLFDAVRAGLGQVAVVTRATLRLVPAPRQVRRFQLFYPDLAAMLGDQRLLTREQRFERVQGAVLRAPAGGRAEHPALPRLPRPAGHAGAAAAVRRPLGVPASVADHLRRRPGGRTGGRRRAGQADPGRPGAGGPGGGLPGPPGVGQDPVAAAAPGPRVLHVQPAAVPADRRRRPGAAHGGGQPGRLRAGPGRRGDAVPGQRRPHVTGRLARPLRGGLRSARRGQARARPGHVLTPGYEVF